MSKFVFNLVYRDKDGEFIDDENVWVSAKDKLEALCRVKEEYPKASSYTLIRSEQYESVFAMQGLYTRFRALQP